MNKYPVVLNLTSDVTLYWMLVDVNEARMRVDLTSNFNNITSYPREDDFLKFKSTIHYLKKMRLLLLNMNYQDRNL